MRFTEWVSQLEKTMAAWDDKFKNLPYTLPLSESTGLDCWRDMYDDNFTPQHAFDEDQACWDS